ncbi:unnamed protein product [Bursaphelenchus xylophilus]|uniref:(pine wood nematode) hypothetical protein n=1 Tax=Bursaphelenchus xylophilus TaxID=6326 RepID=A0A1I7RSL9_BURXY|nr:unnamed protein product [Bursaphelenchus xylophilus]CAG9122874.1 unnamed protein product [Bursaphelenchus xylophilus]
MVKLFVGNLAEGVDSSRLRNLFLQYVQVQECDVLKNFAFVHVVTDEDAELVIEKLEKYNLDGREIHIERSTSRLRKEPGMGDKCFTCGATDHKTPNCPQEETRKGPKRKGGSDDLGEKKKPLLAVSNPGLQFPTTHENDPELPCPQNPELRNLYNQYIESRTKYFFYRERLSKELAMQPHVATSSVPAAPVVARFDMTKANPQVQVKTPQTSAPYMAAQSTPYIPAVVQPAPYQVPQGSYSSSYATAAPHLKPGATISAPATPYSSSTGLASAPYTNQSPAAPYQRLSQPYPGVAGSNTGTPPPNAPYAKQSATYRSPAAPLYATVTYNNR